MVGSSVFEVSRVNDATVTDGLLTEVEDALVALSAHSNKVTAVNDIDGDRTAHELANVNGLVEALTTHTAQISDTNVLVDALAINKQDVITGFTGTYDIIVAVNVVTEDILIPNTTITVKSVVSNTVTIKTVTVENGIIISVI